MDQKWLANGTAVLVLDAGTGEPTIGDGNNGQKPNPDYRPALVALLVTEYHEPAQILDADPLEATDEPAAPAGGVFVPAPEARPANVGELVAFVKDLETKAAAGDTGAQAQLDELNAAFETEEDAAAAAKGAPAA